MLVKNFFFLSSAIVVTVSPIGGVTVMENVSEVVFTYSYRGVDAISENVSLVVNVSTVPLTADSRFREAIAS